MRQSSPHQVLHNRESGALQYAMRDRLTALGFAEIEVIDAAISAARRPTACNAPVSNGWWPRSASARSARSALRKSSRFARNSRHWQQLIEMCRVVDTVLVDQETIDAPGHGNDRLLLGLQGKSPTSTSLIFYAGARLPLAPEGVAANSSWRPRSAFVKAGNRFEEGSGSARYKPRSRWSSTGSRNFRSARPRRCSGSIEHNLGLPTKQANGDTAWRRPRSYATLHRMVENPVYGGAYAYGRTAVATGYRAKGVGVKIRRKARADWLALQPGAHEGYVSWERFEAIRTMVSSNVPTSRHHGAPKHGDALLAGLIRCRRCGRKLTLRYSGARHQIPRYSCTRGWMDNGEPRCIAFGGLRVDDAIEEALLGVVGPGAIAASMAAAEQATNRRDQAREALGRDLEAVRFAADRAFRQYDAADPANRLVAGANSRRAGTRALARVVEVESKITAHEAASRLRRSTRPRSPSLARKPKDGLDRADDGRTVEESASCAP